jgi:tetratricopeptide (TPR) repeat protein
VNKLPHWTILCVALGAFLLPIMGGHLSIESGNLLAGDNVFLAILSGDQAPFLTHFFLSLLFFIPICANLLAKKINHVVNLRISFWLATLGACIGVSIAVSSFPAVTIGVVLEWAMMSMAFFAVTLCCGRKQSSIPILSFVAGSTLAAILGIAEYGAMKAFDPGFRIFAMQVGPNQAGALFATGTVLCLAMAFRFERVARLSLILSAVMQCFALALTQSKGAIVCLPIGILFLVIGLLILKAAKPVAIVSGILIPLMLTGGLAVAMQKAAKSQSSSAVMSRVISSGAEASQSQDFRKLLWSSAIDLTKQRPYGWGMGTFWYESTRPGKITQTTLAHQTFLQLAAEASPIAAISLVGFLCSVVIWGLRGIKTQSDDNKILLIGLLGALSVSVAHNLVDSDMYVFGLGALVFLLCGSFVASSSDSQAPEYIFALPKIAFGATAVLLIPICMAVGFSELYRAKARGALSQNDSTGITANSNTALTINFIDGQAFALKALVTRAEEDFVNATKLHPSPKSFRALSDYFQSKQMYNESYNALNRALERDPNNGPALLKYVQEAIESGNNELANQKARRLVEIEKSSYFTVRSQPEFIPTQSYVARVILAKLSSSNEEKSAFLRDAVKGFAQYRDITGPVILRNLAVLPTGTFGGESRKTLEENYKMAIDACNELAKIQRLAPRDLGFDVAAEAAKFTGALEALNK